jgi:hypothetical protein
MNDMVKWEIPVWHHEHQTPVKTMKNNTKFKVLNLAPLGASLLISINLAPRAGAQIETEYTYHGNNYNQLAGTYLTGGPYALNIQFTTTLVGSALDNLSFQSIATAVTSFSFTDGSGLTLNNVNNPSALNAGVCQIATDASGTPVEWLVGAGTDGGNIQMQSNWQSPNESFSPGADFSETTVNFGGSYGFISDSPGTWTATTITIPERSPLTIAAFGGALLVFLNGTARRCAMSKLWRWN